MGDQRLDAAARIFQTNPSRRRLLGGSLVVAIAVGLAASVEEATAGNVKKRLRKKRNQEQAQQLERNQNIANQLQSMSADVAALEALADRVDQVPGLHTFGSDVRTIAGQIESKRAEALEWVW
jgi:hypothetical protein